MSYFPTAYSNVAVTGSSGQYLVSTNANTTWNTTWSQNVKIQGKLLQLDEDADIQFGDASLMETLREIRSQLAMITPDPKLEAEFEELRACAQEYERLRAKFLEQKRMWEILKQEMIDQ